jgi:riboflavin kinase/FMN adenylyltransferase
MKIYNKFFKSHIPRVVTIGVFDGVHIAHQRIIEEVIKTAKRENKKSLVITFKNHPEEVLSKLDIKWITSISQKLNIFSEYGIDEVVLLKFTKQIYKMAPYEFIQKLKNLNATTIVVGEDFKFGNKREGDIDTLKSMFNVIVIPQIKMNECVVSSTLIRELIFEGNFDTAEKLLGRKYLVEGKVVKGNRYGTLIGYPTANIITEQILPKDGVYQVEIIMNTTKFNGVSNIGYCPTFDKKKKTFEVHIINFNKNLYNKKINIIFKKRLRDEMKFSSPYELKKMIEKDIQLINN